MTTPPKAEDVLSVLTDEQFAEQLKMLDITLRNENRFWRSDLVREAARRLSAPAGDVMDKAYQEMFNSRVMWQGRAIRAETALANAEAALEVAPAAPRVGDAAQEALRLYVKWGTLHENSECPEDDTCTCYVARTVNAALSAPPAASADEHGLDKASGFIQEAYDHLDNHRSIDARRCLERAENAIEGYRKLAPAQSVGQSAAQGVFVPQSVWDWLMGEGDSFIDAEPPHPKYKRNFWWRKELRKRLSALPKGQDDEE